MKVAYIAPYKDGTGYAKAAQEFIRCLDYVGIDVVPVWITLSNNLKETHPRILELEKKDLNNVDIIIQHSLPEHFCKAGNIPTVGLFYWETSHFRGSNWQYSLNLLDRVWCTTREQVEACKLSGVTTPICEINFAQDFSKYEKEYEKLNIPGINHLYKFYTIGEISSRKNIGSLIQAFLSEFSTRDSVCLIIKGFMDGKTAQETERYFENLVNEIKIDLRLDKVKTPPIILISEYLSEEQIMRLHATCDCYVSLSRGEGQCIPALDAAGMKRPVISSGWGGTRKMFEDTEHVLITKLIERPILGMKNSLPHLYNRDETWYEPSGAAAKYKMRSLYENRMPKEKIESSFNTLKSLFSYEKAGQILKRDLEKLL